MSTSEPYSVDKLTAEARRLAADYRRATGKTLPLSSEIAVNDAIRLLELERPPEPIVGADAIRRSEGAVKLVQIKGRVLFNESKGSPRIGQLKLEQPWDETVLVILDDEYEPQEIYSAERRTIEAALNDKRGDSFGACIGIGPCIDHVGVSIRTVSDPHFVAIQYIDVTLLFRFQLHTDDIGPGAGL